MDIRAIIEPFVGPVSEATLIFPFAAGLAALPFALYHYRKHGHHHPWRAFLDYSFIYYLIAAFFLVILPLPSHPIGPADLEAWNERYGSLRRPCLDPSAFVRAILDAPQGARRSRALFQAIFNFLLLLPFGAYLAYLFKRRIPAAFLWGLGLSLFFEFCQFSGNFWTYPGPYRLFDVGDLILNSTGALAGAALARLAARIRLLPDLDSLQGPSKPWIGFFRRTIAASIDGAAIVVSAMALAFVAGLFGAPALSSNGIFLGSVAAFWLVLLPALDSGRGLGKRLTFSALRMRDGAEAGFLRLLGRQSLAWGPPIAALVAFSAPSPGVVVSAIVALGFGAWCILGFSSAVAAMFDPERAGWLDRRLGTRVRNAWKAQKPRATRKPSR